MTDQTVAPAAADADAHPSQIIEHVETHEVPRAGTVPEAEQPKDEGKAPSTRDAIAKAFDEAEKASKAEKEAKEAPKDDEAKPEEKAEAKDEKAVKEDGKIAKAEKAEEPEAKAEKGAPEKAAAERSAPEEPRQSEGRKYAEPPARFLPEARTKWANVPNEVKAEFHRVAEEFEREVAEHKQFREELREYEEMAKQHNVTIKGTLDRYVSADRALSQNFGRGVAQLMQMYGHNPAQAISSVMQAVGVTPQQFAEYVAKNPQIQQAATNRAPDPMARQQQSQSPDFNALKTEIEELKAELHTSKVTPLIERFASEHSDYQTLEPQIAEILKSGVIEKIYGTGLDPEQKLAEAYRMAGGSMSPSRSDPAPAPHHSDAEKAVPSDDAGTKSIKGAPTAGHTGQPKWVPKSNREALERAFAGAR